LVTDYCSFILIIASVDLLLEVYRKLVLSTSEARDVELLYNYSVYILHVIHDNNCHV